MASLLAHMAYLRIFSHVLLKMFRWGAHRGEILLVLVSQRLRAAGNYLNPAATAVATWTAVLGLLNIQPPVHMYRFDSTQVISRCNTIRQIGWNLLSFKAIRLMV